jgi:hypothetical protein
MRAEFLFCARGIEVAGQLTSADRKRHTTPYGPTGKDIFFSEVPHPPIPSDDMVDLILTALSNPEQAKKDLTALRKKIPVAVFKVNIAKQHLETYNDRKEAYPFRYVALPIDDKYGPWVRGLIERYHDAGDHVVFDLSRQDNWEHITRKDLIFRGLVYPIKKYHYYPNGDITAEPVPCFSHNRKFRCHALRHVRTDQLIGDYLFDGFDLAALVGWSMGSSSKVSQAPVQAGNYAEIRQAWRRYIHKQCKPFDHISFNGKQEKQNGGN